MKKRFTRGEKWLFASPLLFLVIAALVWMRQKSAPYSIDLPVGTQVRTLEFSPDSGRLLVSYLNRKPSLNVRQVYDVEARSKVCDLEAPASLMSRGGMGRYYSRMSWSPDGKSIVGNAPDTFMASRVAISGEPDNISIWDARSGSVKADFASVPTHERWFGAEVRLSSDGKTLIRDGFPPLRYSATTGKLLGRHAAPRFEAGDVFNEKLGLVAVYGAGKNFRVVDVNTKRVLWRPQLGTLNQYGWQGDVLCVKFDDGEVSDQEPVVMSGLLIWDGKTRQPLHSPPEPYIGDFSFSPDGKTIAYHCATMPQAVNGVETESNGGELLCYDYRANRILWSHPSTEPIENLQWSPDGKWLAAKGKLEGQTTLFVFDTAGKIRFEFESVGFLSRWSPDSQRLAILAVNSTSNKGRPIFFERLEIHRIEE